MATTPLPPFNLGAAIDAAGQTPVLQGGTNTAGGGAAAAGGNIYYQPLDYGYTNQFILAGDQRRAPTTLAPVTLTPIGPTTSMPLQGPQGTPMNFGDPAAPMGGPLQGTAQVTPQTGGSLRVGNKTYPMNQLVADASAGQGSPLNTRFYGVSADYGDGNGLQPLPQYGLQPPMQGRMAPVPYPMNAGGYPQIPQSAPPFVRAMPQMVPQDPAAVWAQQQQMRLARQAMRNSAAPLPMVPQPVGSQGGFVGRMQRLAGSLNPQIGKRNQAAFTGQVQMYNNAVDAQRQWGQVAQGALSNIATNQTGIDKAQYEQNWQFAMKYAQTGTTGDYNTAVNHMMDMFPTPGPERDAYIDGMYRMTNGAVDMSPVRLVKNPKGEQMMQGRDLDQEKKEGEIRVQKATEEARIAKANAQAAQAEIRARILKDSQDSIVDLNKTRADRAKIDKDLRAKYGDAQAAGIIASMEQSRREQDRHAFEGALSAQKNLVDEYTKLKGQRNSLLIAFGGNVPKELINRETGERKPNPKYQELEEYDNALKAFGPADKTTGIPKAVADAMRFMGAQGSARPSVTLPRAQKAISAIGG